MERLKHHAHRALRHSEKYFKTDMVYLAKGSFWLASLQGVSSLAAFLLAIAFANLVSPEVYGTYKYILSIAAIIGTFSLTGLTTAVTQSVARGFDGALKHAFKLNLEWSWMVVLASLVMTGYYFYNGNTTLGFAFIVVGVLTPILNSTTFFSSFLSGKKDFKTQSIYGSINSILPALAVILTIVFTENILTIIFIYFLAQVVVELALYLLVLKKYKPNDAEIDEAMFSYSAHMSTMNILNMISMRLDSILLFHYLGAAQVALYAFATAIPEQIRGLTKSIGAIALPKWSTRSFQEIHTTLWEKFWKFIISLAALSVLYVLAAPFVYKIFFPQYVAAIGYSQYFAISLIAGASIIPTMILQSQKMTRQLYQLNLISSIFQIGLLLLLVPFYGIIGTITAILISRFFSLGVGFFLIHK